MRKKSPRKKPIRDVMAVIVQPPLFIHTRYPGTTIDIYRYEHIQFNQSQETEAEPF